MMARDPHQTALIAAARRLGAGVEDLLPRWGIDAVRYHRSGRSALVIEGCTFEQLSHVTDRLCANKQATRCWLAELGLPVPQGAVLEPGLRPEAVARLLPASRPLVCKPLDGTNGEGVVMDLVDLDGVMAAARACWQEGPALVESQISGADLRIQVIGGALVAACERRPASLTGDGAATISALAARRDAVVRAQNPQNRLILDETSLALLAAAGLSPDDVLPTGQVVQVKSVANIAQGAVPVDITEQLHPRYRQWVETLRAALAMDIFAVDIIAEDPAADPREGGAVVLEINARPQWLHHTFSQRRTHDIPTLILDSLLGAP